MKKDIIDFTSRVGQIFYGGDYNPDQWDEATWQEDMELMKQAGVNLITIGTWNWVRINPREGEYDFSFWDTIIGMLHDNGIYVDLSTPTASPPPWMSKKYPEILPVMSNGQRWAYGSRQTFCPSSPRLLDFTKDVTQRIAERYGKHPALAAWHLNNEYSQFVVQCYCELCEQRFREWLKEKYGSLEAVNQAWGTEFWGNTCGEWDEIISPRDTAHQQNPAKLLDYKRFTSDNYMVNYLEEVKICRELSPGVPITTNFLYEYDNLDYYRWSQIVDFVAVSSFPDPAPGESRGIAPFSHAKMRGHKHGAPFVILEQAANNVNWRETNSNKAPGIMRQWSMQSLGHGADGLCFFQWRASRSGAEKFHSAIVSHCGADTRVFREICALGEELEKLDVIRGSLVKNRVAMVFDYESWWAAEYKPGPTELLEYNEQLKKYYLALWEQNLGCDLVFGTDPEFDLSGYDVLIAPIMYILHPGMAEKIRAFVERGGTFLTTWSSCMVDEDDRVFLGGTPGPLRDVLGMWIEEFETLFPEAENGIKMESSDLAGVRDEGPCKIWADIIRLDNAECLARYTGRYYQGEPAFTLNKFGQGKAYYLGTDLEMDHLKEVLGTLCREAGVKPVLETPAGIEAVIRTNGEKSWLFVLNHNEEEVNVALPDKGYTNISTGEACDKEITMAPFGAVALEIPNN